MAHLNEINPTAIFICSTNKRELYKHNFTNRFGSLYTNDNNIYDNDDVHRNIQTFSPHKYFNPIWTGGGGDHLVPPVSFFVISFEPVML